VFEFPENLPGVQDIACSLHKATLYKIHALFDDRVRKFIDTYVDELEVVDRIREVERLSRAEELNKVKSFREAQRVADAERSRVRKRHSSIEHRPHLDVDGDLDKFDVAE
jgi:hypothetical protein